MNPIDGLLYGFQIALTPVNLLAVVVGSLFGTLIGVLPGIGPIAGMAMLLTALSGFAGPETGLIMLAGIYYGAMYGGSTTAILVNVPGETTSIVTCIDGHQMARNGRAGAALAISAVGSFVAGTVAIVGLMFFAPLLATWALAFGPPEFFALMLIGLLALSRLSGGSFWKSVLMLTAGLAVAEVGMDRVSGFSRYTFGVVDLQGGIDIVPAIMGLYGLSEMLFLAEKKAGAAQVIPVKFRELWPTREEWRRSWMPIVRASGLGFVLGLLPGPSAIISTFLSYKAERHFAKHPEEFGHGAIEAVAGPEAANNAASTASMIPLLALGIPWGAATTLLLAALMMKGIQPGPLLISEHPDVFWGIIASMYVGNVILLLLNLPLVGIWVSLLRLPESVIMACVVLFMVIGAYSIDNSLTDVAVLLIMGIVGYFLRKFQFDLAPMILAMVIGPLLENAFRQSLFMSQGSLMVFAERPLTAGLLLAGVALLLAPRARAYLLARRAMTNIGP